MTLQRQERERGRFVWRDALVKACTDWISHRAISLQKESVFAFRQDMPVHGY